MTIEKTVLITGATGFIGRYIARYFHQKKWKTIGVSNSPPENAPLSVLSHYYQLNLPHLNFLDLVKNESPNLCVHCAGRASVGISLEYPLEDFYANTNLTIEVLNTLRLYAPQCEFIFLSSAAVYGNPSSLPITETHDTLPISPYGFHKLQSEQICEEFSKIYGLKTASVRIFSAYGPGLRRQVVWDICSKALTNSSLELRGTGNESRDFIHPWDIAQAVEIIHNKSELNGDIYNLANGEEITIKELTNLIIQCLDISPLVKFDNVVNKGNPLNWKADISKIQSIGFSPVVEFRQGLTTFVRWCQAELLGY
jgi:UDP-glucose 4-epimerase